MIHQSGTIQSSTRKEPHWTIEKERFLKVEKGLKKLLAKNALFQAKPSSWGDYKGL